MGGAVAGLDGRNFPKYSTSRTYKALMGFIVLILSLTAAPSGPGVGLLGWSLTVYSRNLL
jgi:hypothetical protein